jgi:hypothetical protein
MVVVVGRWSLFGGGRLLRFDYKHELSWPRPTEHTNHNGVHSKIVARGGAMGHLHPPKQNCYALYRIKFSNIFKQLILIDIF